MAFILPGKGQGAFRGPRVKEQWYHGIPQHEEKGALSRASEVTGTQELDPPGAKPQFGGGFRAQQL